MKRDDIFDGKILKDFFSEQVESMKPSFSETDFFSRIEKGMSSGSSFYPGGMAVCFAVLILFSFSLTDFPFTHNSSREHWEKNTETNVQYFQDLIEKGVK